MDVEDVIAPADLAELQQLAMRTTSLALAAAAGGGLVGCLLGVRTREEPLVHVARTTVGDRCQVRLTFRDGTVVLAHPLSRPAATLLARHCAAVRAAGGALQLVGVVVPGRDMPLRLVLTFDDGAGLRVDLVCSYAMLG